MSNNDTENKVDGEGFTMRKAEPKLMIPVTPPTQSESGLEDSIEHCINSLIGIVKHTESFNHDPEKKARQLERNRSSTAEAKITLKALVAQREDLAYKRGLNDGKGM